MVRALAALPKDLGSIPAPTKHGNSSSRVSDTLFYAPPAPGTHMVHSYTRRKSIHADTIKCLTF